MNFNKPVIDIFLFVHFIKNVLSSSTSGYQGLSPNRDDNTSLIRSDIMIHLFSTYQYQF